MLIIDDSQETGIEETVNSQPTNHICYDLQGRRLGNIPSRGIYIKGGKKFIVK